MKQGQFISEEKLFKQTIGILMEKLGPVETNRFLSLPSRERMESVRRYQTWQSKLDKETFFNEVFGNQIGIQ
ncbi:hypothetical protein KKE26_00910 [bacterium]|nr:hypothetical protein [bacterium]MBU1754500.1 hypothetical protein [bacterium]